MIITDYDELEDILRKELNRIEKGKMLAWLKENGLENKKLIISRIMNKGPKNKTSKLVIKILEIFGYRIETKTYIQIVKEKKYEGKYYSQEEPDSQ